MLYFYHESCTKSNKSDDNQTRTLVLCTTIPSICLLLFSVVMVILWRKGFICNDKTSNQNVITHKNDLYGNLTNQDYFDQRYDTNITDRNQYYEGEGEQYVEYVA